VHCAGVTLSGTLCHHLFWTVTLWHYLKLDLKLIFSRLFLANCLDLSAGASNVFLKRARKFGFTETLYCIEDLLEKSDTRHFTCLKNLLISFIPSYLVIINLVRCFWEKEGIRLPFHTVFIICTKIRSYPLVFLSSYNVCVIVLYYDFVFYIMCYAVFPIPVLVYCSHLMSNNKDWLTYLKFCDVQCDAFVALSSLLTYLLTYTHCVSWRRFRV